MTLLVTIFLVLVNIFNTIQTNSPKAEGLTAIEAWVIACIIFVFGALSEYTVLLLKIKLEKCFPKHSRHHSNRPR
jgi:sterol desaturase/sphingolipid hydroxylase (fatty acid hydroxylase superfamily)